MTIIIKVQGSRFFHRLPSHHRLLTGQGLRGLYISWSMMISATRLIVERSQKSLKKTDGTTKVALGVQRRNFGPCKRRRFLWVWVKSS